MLYHEDVEQRQHHEGQDCKTHLDRALACLKGGDCERGCHNER